MSGGQWLQFWLRHRGKIVGAVLGFVIAVAIKKWGILWTLFIALAVLVGYTVGRYFDGDQEGLLSWIDRLLPPGRR